MASSGGKGGMVEGVCSNLPNRCEKAASKEVQRTPASSAICTNCGRSLKLDGKRPEKDSTGLPMPAIAAGIVLLIAIIGGGLYITKDKLFSSHQACEMSASLESIPTDQLLASAESCRMAGKLDPLVRLLTVAKERGSAEAAIRLGGLYDPVDASQQDKVHLKPSVLISLEFYRQACELKSPEAGKRLAGLKPAAEKEASETGDRLLTDQLEHWPDCAVSGAVQSLVDQGAKTQQ